MTNVKRWGQTWDGIFPQDDGDFVEFDEYQKLKAQRDEILATLKLAETWLEGWASAAHELSIIRAQIAKCEAQS